MKIDAEEKEILDSVERGERRSAGAGKRERARFSRYAKATFKKDRRLNIRLSSKDLEAIQKRALAEGLPYQTLIASLLHTLRPAASKKSEEQAATRARSLVDVLASVPKRRPRSSRIRTCGSCRTPPTLAARGVLNWTDRSGSAR
jgi:predicted DNA binding CopG/RHH family protein